MRNYAYYAHNYAYYAERNERNERNMSVIERKITQIALPLRYRCAGKVLSNVTSAIVAQYERNLRNSEHNYAQMSVIMRCAGAISVILRYLSFPATLFSTRDSL